MAMPYSGPVAPLTTLAVRAARRRDAEAQPPSVEETQSMVEAQSQRVAAYDSAALIRAALHTSTVLGLESGTETLAWTADLGPVPPPLDAFLGSGERRARAYLRHPERPDRPTLSLVYAEDPQSGTHLFLVIEYTDPHITSVHCIRNLADLGQHIRNTS